MSFWKHITNIGIRPDDDINALRKMRLINQMCFLSTFVPLFFVPYIYFIGSHFYAPILLAFGLISGIYYFLNHKRHFLFSLYWVLSITYINVFWGSLEAPKCGIEFFALPLSLIPFTVITNKRVCIGFVGIAIAIVLLSWYVKKIYTPQSTISDFYSEMTYIVSLITIFLLCPIIIYQFRNINSQYEYIIHEQKLEVESKNKDITDSIHYARRIQQSQLPSHKYIEKNWERLRNLPKK